jgi:thiol-disulfide isomerase/thioredoxin
MLTCINSQAQLSKVEGTLSARKATSLHVGDYVPDRDFKVSNSKEKQVNLAHFKGKWILLDLWGVYCGTCIQHMPDAEELQRKYQDQLKVIMVSRNTDQQVQKVAKFAENVRNNKLPFINGPDQLAGLFDFSFVPQYIWIDPDGMIRYMTNDQFSGDTVKNILDGKNYQVTEKKTILFAHTEVPIITNLYPLFGDKFYTYSYLAPHDDSKYDYDISFRSSLGFNGPPKTEKGYFSFKQLYQAAYSFYTPNNPLPDERVILNFDDTAHYSDPAKTYDYEIIIHKNIPEQRVRKYMQTQFDLFFNVSSHLEKRLVPCLVFKRFNNGHDCVVNEKDTTVYDRYGDHMLRAITHWKALFSYLNFTYIAPPHTVIDETGITGDKVVKVNINLDFDHLEKMNKSLEACGLTVVQENRMMDCIVINEISN